MFSSKSFTCAALLVVAVAAQAESGCVNSATWSYTVGTGKAALRLSCESLADPKHARFCSLTTACEMSCNPMCRSPFQLRARRQLQKKNKKKKKSKKKQGGKKKNKKKNKGSGAGTFCNDSPDQTCKMLCHQGHEDCEPGSCLMRIGTCCDIQCVLSDGNGNSAGGNKKKKKGKKKQGGKKKNKKKKKGSGAGTFCNDSPDQTCKMLCHQGHEDCEPGSCLMRIGTCCDVQCVLSDGNGNSAGGSDSASEPAPTPEPAPATPTPKPVPAPTSAPKDRPDDEDPPWLSPPGEGGGGGNGGGIGLPTPPDGRP